MKESVETPEAGDLKNQTDRIIPVVEEEVVTGKKIVKKGTVTIEKKINEEDSQVEMPVTSEVVNIEHIPQNQIIDTWPNIRHEGETIIIPVVKEVIVKKLMLVEEIRITKEIRTDMVRNNVILKKEEVIISRKEQSANSDKSQL
jgi:stress response protein YsnF